MKKSTYMANMQVKRIKRKFLPSLFQGITESVKVKKVPYQIWLKLQKTMDAIEPLVESQNSLVKKIDERTGMAALTERIAEFNAKKEANARYNYTPDDLKVLKDNEEAHMEFGNELVDISYQAIEEDDFSKLPEDCDPFRSQIFHLVTFKQNGEAQSV